MVATAASELLTEFGEEGLVNLLYVVWICILDTKHEQQRLPLGESRYDGRFVLKGIVRVQKNKISRFQYLSEDGVSANCRPIPGRL